LTIDFQEGFQNDTLVLRIAGVETTRHEHLTTRLQTGYAAACTAAVPAGRVVLDVDLPATKASGQVVLDVQAPMWVGVNLDPGRVFRFKVSDSPFGYV
jgi:hypothetical protein